MRGRQLRQKGSRLHCGTIRLGLPSVGATENSILAAVLLPGETRIEHAAQEPEIDELIRFLNLRGGKLQRMGDAIVIEGGRCLHPVRFRIASDRIVAGTYLFAAAAAGGELHLQNYAADQTLAGVLLQMGGICRADHLGGMYFQMKHRPKALPGIRTGPLSGISDRSAVAIDGGAVHGPTGRAGYGKRCLRVVSVQLRSCRRWARRFSCRGIWPP